MLARRRTPQCRKSRLGRGVGLLLPFALLFTAVLVSAVQRLSADLQDPPPSSASDPVLSSIGVATLTVDHIDSEGLQVVAHVRATANRTATLDRLVFDHVTVDGLPLNLPPLDGPIQLKKGEPLLNLPPVRARVNFRDLISLEPLRHMVESKSVRFRATARSRVSLGLFAQIALRTVGAWVITAVDQDVPVHVPGGTLGQLSGVAALTAAEPLWRVAQAVRARRDAVIEKRASDGLRDSLLALETRYQLRARSGDIAWIRVTSMAFFVEASTALAPAEAVQPWIFDASIAEALARGDATLVKTSVSMEATRVQGESGRLATALEPVAVRVTKMPDGNDVAVSPTTRRRFRLRLRVSDSNVALLALESGTSIVSASSFPEATWQQAVVVRLRRTGTGIEPVFLHTAVRQNAGRVELRDAVDADAYGSPIWTEGGIVGIVQSSTSGAHIAAAMKSVGLDVRKPLP